MSNLKKYQNNSSLSENKVLTKEDFAAWKEERNSKKNINSLNEAEKKEIKR